jgi:ethanolamine-phosphate cytidylyltransferase
MLMCSRDNTRFTEEREKQQAGLAREFSRGRETESEADSEDGDDALALVRSPRPVSVSRFMPTSRRIVQFSSGKSAPAGGRIVYIDGAFDLFHAGHVAILKTARAQGDFLLVGIHTDDEVAERRGPHLPIMALHERALSVLACKYVDEVVIGAPMHISDDMLTTFGISLVVRGTVHEALDKSSEEDRYSLARERGIIRELTSPVDVTSATLIRRIVQNRAQFEERQAKKVKSEADYYTSAKTYVNEI